MKNSSLKSAGLAKETTEAPARLILWLASGLALASYALVIASLVTPLSGAKMQGGLEAIMLVAATLATLAALARELPTQNVVLAGLILALIGGGLHTLGAATAMPFGPFIYLGNIGPCFQKVLAWPMPMMWVVLIINSRGVVRLILRPWRKLKNYGLWLIAATALLVVLMDFLLDPYASITRHYWVWEPTNIAFTWQGAPVTNFFGWTVGSLLMLAFATPAMVKKRSSSLKAKPFYHPLVLWELMGLLFTAGAFEGKLWPVVGVGVALLLIVPILAVRGARW